MAMVSLKRPSKKGDKGSEGIAMHDVGFPEVHLNHEHLKALGMHEGPLPAVGDKVHLHAIAHVSHAAEETDGEGKPRRRLSLELHKVDKDALTEGKTDEEKRDEATHEVSKAIDGMPKAKKADTSKGGKKDE